MHKKTFLRSFLLVLALVFLLFSLVFAFALAEHAGCTSLNCVPCVQLAKAQNIFRQFLGIFVVSLGLIALLSRGQFWSSRLFCALTSANLIHLKVRLNN